MAEEKTSSDVKKETQNIIPLYKKPFYLNWFLDGNYLPVFAKLSVLFLVIWSIGLIIAWQEKNLIIQDGHGEYEFSISKCDSLIEHVDIADNKLILMLKMLDENELSVKTVLKNIKCDSTKNTVQLKRYNSWEHYSEIDTYLIGRKLHLEFRSSGNNIKVKASVSAVGFLEDYPNYFLFIGLLIATFLLRVLMDKFVYAFSGNKKIEDSSELNIIDNEGLLRILKIKDSFPYKNLLTDNFNQISINTNKAKYWFIGFFFAVLFITLVLSLRHTESKYLFNLLGINITPENWNFSKNTFPFSYYYNLVKDILINAIIIQVILFKVFLIFIYTVKLSSDFDTDKMYDTNVLSYDRAGGLSPLGEIVLTQFYMFIVFFPSVYFTGYLLDFPLHLHIILPIYLLFTFCLFFIPLNTPHNTMKKAKEKALKTISDQYEKLDEEYQTIDINDDKEFNRIYKKMKKIQLLYKEREKMPVWPYDFEILIKFGTVFILNLLLYLSKYTVNLLN
ncbi:MAG: hypothetical protein ACTSWD_14135 [Candidatus Heimdallarchaeota archaeon]